MELTIVAITPRWRLPRGVQQWLKSPRAMKIANRASATAMGGAAVVIATR